MLIFIDAQSLACLRLSGKTWPTAESRCSPCPLASGSIKRKLHGWLRQTLTCSEVIQQLFEPAVVARMLDQHRDGRGNFTRELHALAALALWKTAFCA